MITSLESIKIVKIRIAVIASHFITWFLSTFDHSDSDMVEKRNTIDGIGFLAAVKEIIVRRKLLLSVIFLISLGATITLYFTQQPYYETKLTAKSRTLSFSIIKNLIEPLNTHLKQENYEGLAQKLGITIKEATYIKGFEINEFVRNERARDFQFPGSSTLVDYATDFEIVAEIYDNSIIPALQAGIVNYLIGNDFISKEAEFSEQKTTKMVELLESQINQLDSLQKKLATLQPSDIGQGILDYGSIYTAMQEAAKLRYQLKKQLTFQEDIQVVGELAVYAKTTAPRLWLYLLNGLIIGLLFSIFIVAVIEINSIIKGLEAH